MSSVNKFLLLFRIDEVKKRTVVSSGLFKQKISFAANDGK